MGTPPLPPYPHTQAPPLSTPLLEWYICDSEPTLSHQDHSKPIVYMRIHSCCTSYGFGKRCNDMSPPLPYHAGWFHCLKKSSVFYFILGFPGGSAGKDSACNSGDLGQIPGLGRSPEERKGYPLQYSGLENSTDYIVHGALKELDRTERLSLHFCLFISLPFLHPWKPLIFLSSPQFCLFQNATVLESNHVWRFQKGSFHI